MNEGNYLTQFNTILCGMSKQMLNQNITIDFIRSMLTIYQAQIDMSNNLLQNSSYEPLLQIVRNIVGSNASIIQQMQQILISSNEYTNCCRDFCCYSDEYMRIARCMINRMERSSRCQNINLDFICEIIPLCEGIILISKNLLRYSVNPTLMSLVENIIAEQTEFVKELVILQASLCNQDI